MTIEIRKIDDLGREVIPNKILIDRRMVDDLGRVVIPNNIRKEHGIQAGDELVIVSTNTGLFIYTEEQWEREDE